MTQSFRQTALTLSALCWIASAYALAQQSNTSPPSAPVTFASACEYVLQRYAVNIVGDVYLTGDTAVTEWQTRNLSAQQAVEQLARTYEREVVRVGNTYVLRAKKSAFRRHQDVLAQTHHGAKWATEGVLSINTAGGQISIRAAVLPLSRLARSLSEKTGWSLHIENDLQDLRIVARWQNASIAEVIEALALLLRTEKHVWLSRSDEQKRKEQEEFRESVGNLTASEQASQQLLPKLVELLTPEERARWMEGEMVELPLSRLPTEIFAEAYDYATREFQRFYERAPEEVRPPLDLINDHRSIFLILPAPGQNAISIRIEDNKNGRSYIF